MTQVSPKKSTLAVILTVAIACVGAVSPVSAQPEPLTLRLNDAVGRPGGVTALVFRTYASRPAGQGQICTIIALGPSMAGSVPFSALVGSEVLSGAGDARWRAALGDAAGVSQDVVVRFRSPSGTINSSDGPLAVIFVRVDPNAVPGTEIDFVLDPGETFLLDPNGAPITLEPVSGTLEILSVAAGYPVAAEGDKIRPGETALISFQTAEPRRLQSGQVAFEYDPAIVSGSPVVRMNPGYGQSEFTVDDLTPGLIVVSFTSPGRSLNRIPGDLIEIDLPTAPGTPLGTVSRLSLNSDLTFLVDSRGDLLPLIIEAPDSIEFE